MHYYFEKDGRRLSLVGTVITLFDEKALQLRGVYIRS